MGNEMQLPIQKMQEADKKRPIPPAGHLFLIKKDHARIYR